MQQLTFLDYQLDQTSKRCSVCKLVKSVREFCKDSTRSGGYHHRCKTCQNAYNDAHRDHQRDNMLQARYGISVQEYKRMLEVQNGVCAVCRLPEKKISAGRRTVASLHVDHCHRTGRVRALLCHDCNAALGLLQEDEARIEALRVYVLQNK